MKEAADFRHIIVAQRANGPVYLSQVAEISDGAAEEQSISRVNGERAISLEIAKVQDANTVEVGNGVKAAIEAMKTTLPKDVQFRVLDDKAKTVQGQLDNVKETILEGALLTIVIVFLFLHSWRSTVITGLTLPISVLRQLHRHQRVRLHAELHDDDGAVAVHRPADRRRDRGAREHRAPRRHGQDHHMRGAEDGTDEIGLAVMATTFAIVAVFVPVAFMKGIIGKFFLPFGITVASAVLVSLFVSFTLDPMLSSVWPDPAKDRFKYMPWLGRLMARIEVGIEHVHGWYAKVLGLALAWRKSTLLLAVALFAGSLMLIPKIGGEFVPQTDDGFVQLKFKTAVGSSLDYTDAKMRQVESALAEFKEIESVQTIVAAWEGRNTSMLNVKLTDVRKTHRRSQQDMEKVIRDRLSSIPGIGMTVGNRPIFIAILGSDEVKLDAVAHRLMDKMKKIKGVADIEYSQEGANPATIIKINHEMANDLGLNVQQIGAALRPFVAGDQTNRWLAPDGQNYEVNVQLPKSGREKVADLADLSVASSRLDAAGNPVMVPLRQVVEFLPSTSPQVLKRQALERRVAVYAGLEGRPLGDVMGDVDKAMKSIELPAGVRFDVGGQAQEMNETMGGFVVALGIAVIFIYLVLASQFGSFLQPIAIMVSLPLSMIGVLLALLVTKTTLNMFSIIGIVMLMGLVTKNAILLVDFANHGQREGKAAAARGADGGRPGAACGRS